MRIVRQAVDELRDRLYRPAPPPGAVAAHLDAVRTAEGARPPGAEAPVLPPQPRRRRARVRRLVCAGLLVVSAATLVPGVLAVQTPSGATDAADRPAEPAAGAPTTSGPGWPPVTGVPIGRLRGDGRAGAGSFAAGGRHAVVSVNCTGEGTFTVRIGSDDPVVLVCDRGAVAFALVASRAAVQRFRLVVVPEGPVRWSLAVGAIDLPPA